MNPWVAGFKKAAEQQKEYNQKQKDKAKDAAERQKEFNRKQQEKTKKAIKKVTEAFQPKKKEPEMEAEVELDEEGNTKLDEEGNPIQKLDEEGKPIMKLKETKPSKSNNVGEQLKKRAKKASKSWKKAFAGQKKGTTAEPEPEMQLDDEGNVKKDEEGNSMPKLDEEGNPVMKTQEAPKSNPIVEGYKKATEQAGQQAKKTTEQINSLNKKQADNLKNIQKKQQNAFKKQQAAWKKVASKAFAPFGKKDKKKDKATKDEE